mmetsp:Transcript_125797/g.218097  ORF Transcript_125797/g.218097 Transcript_125797/m.218097 type:complete len:113 (-) Transcript_125797:135-473(-)
MHTPRQQMGRTHSLEHTGNHESYKDGDHRTPNQYLGVRARNTGMLQWMRVFVLDSSPASSTNLSASVCAVCAVVDDRPLFIIYLGAPSFIAPHDMGPRSSGQTVALTTPLFN